MSGIKSWGILAAGTVGGGLPSPPDGGVNTALVHAIWSYSDPTGADITIGSTLTGTDVGTGYWLIDFTGIGITCTLSGHWKIEITGLVNHAGTPGIYVPTVVRLNESHTTTGGGTTTTTTIFDESMTNGDTIDLVYSGTSYFTSLYGGDSFNLSFTHITEAGAGGTSNLFSGDLILTRLGP